MTSGDYPLRLPSYRASHRYRFHPYAGRPLRHDNFARTRDHRCGDDNPVIVTADTSCEHDLARGGHSPHSDGVITAAVEEAFSASIDSGRRARHILLLIIDLAMAKLKLQALRDIKVKDNKE